MVQAEKVSDLRDDLNAQGALLDWLLNEKHFALCEMTERERERIEPRWLPVTSRIEDLLAEFHDIDLDELEREKRLELARLREDHEKTEEERLRQGPFSVWLADNASRPLYEQYQRLLAFEAHLSTAHAGISRQLQERRKPEPGQDAEEFERWRASADYARRLTARKLDQAATERAKLSRLVGPNATTESMFLALARTKLDPEQYDALMTEALEAVRRNRRPR